MAEPILQLKDQVHPEAQDPHINFGNWTDTSPGEVRAFLMPKLKNQAQFCFLFHSGLRLPLPLLSLAFLFSTAGG